MSGLARRVRSGMFRDASIMEPALRPTLALLATTALFALAPGSHAQDRPVPAADAANRAFTGNDLFGLQMASDPQISPDGRTIVYVRRSGDVMTDRMQSALWLIDVATGRQTPFATSGSSPRWSPDGTRVAYVAADGERAQLFVRWIATGASTRVTGLPGDPNSLAWSPDGRRLAYVATVSGEATTLGQAPAKPDGAKWAEPLEVIDRVTYRNDGPGYRKPGYDHVFVVAADGGAARQLTFGRFDDGGPLSWAPMAARSCFPPSAARMPSGR
jgi:dipeptidyl aminopeptidase/acylaminoacyl peptidase